MTGSRKPSENKLSCDSLFGFESVYFVMTIAFSKDSLFLNVVIMYQRVWTHSQTADGISMKVHWNNNRKLTSSIITKNNIILSVKCTLHMQNKKFNGVSYVCGKGPFRVEHKRSIWR